MFTFLKWSAKQPSPSPITKYACSNPHWLGSGMTQFLFWLAVSMLSWCPPIDDAELCAREQALKVLTTLGHIRKAEQHVKHTKKDKKGPHCQPRQHRKVSWWQQKRGAYIRAIMRRGSAHCVTIWCMSEKMNVKRVKDGRQQQSLGKWLLNWNQNEWQILWRGGCLYHMPKVRSHLCCLCKFLRSEMSKKLQKVMQLW